MTHAPNKAIVIRPHAEGDAAATDSILREAFGGGAEANLVTQLRRSESLVVELVAERGTNIAGYIAFPRLRIETASGLIEAAGLAPLAVAPQIQRQGIGSALVEEGCMRLADTGTGIVFVLGNPRYYGRLGFKGDKAARFASPYAGPNFMARVLAANAPASGAIRYPAAFDALG